MQALESIRKSFREKWMSFSLPESYANQAREVNTGYDEVKKDSSELDVHAKLREETFSVLSSLQADLTDVSKIYSDVAQVVQYTHEALDTIEQQTGDTERHVNEGISNVVKAHESKKRLHQRIGIVVTVSIIAGVVVVVIVVLHFVYHLL